jgi:hypothetical protein
MNIESRVSKPDCALSCVHGDSMYGSERRAECPGRLQANIAPPTPASETTGCLVEACRNPNNAGNKPVFSESWDDGADVLTIYTDGIPSPETIHELIAQAKNIG